ncbi:MAG TPA: hypothetical protein VLE73_01575 [Candidatus Saccharimonadales bacterium]|nr:hypothetical protein [Candidatus Saccharimonadales bacterium]
MERAPRITSVYETERALRRHQRMRRKAEERAAEARKKAVTALTVIRMILRLAITPNRDLQGRRVRQSMRIMREGRRVAAGDTSRVFALGRSMLASRP